MALIGGCSGNEGSTAAAGQHHLDTPTIGSPRVIESASDATKIVGGIGAPTVVAESDGHKLVQRGLRPEVKR